MKKNGYATKEDLAALENNLRELFLNSEIKILGELQKIRDDNDAHHFSHMRVNDDLHEHDKRLKKLESAKI